MVSESTWADRRAMALAARNKHVLADVLEAEAEGGSYRTDGGLEGDRYVICWRDIMGLVVGIVLP